jgi:3-oxoadipate enol-lactonase
MGTYRMVPNYITKAGMPRKYLHPMNKKPTLIFIHGFPLDHSSWNRQVDALNDVANVLAPDLRGFGKDDRALPEVMTMEAYAEDLKVLLDEQGVEHAVLCGLSMGGYIALAFLAAWPERVAGLVLANTRANADDEQGRKGREETAQNAFDKGMEVMARGMLPKLLTDRTRNERPATAEHIASIIAEQRPEAVAAAARGMAVRVDRLPQLPSITVPTLIITGSDDALMPLPTSQTMADAIPNSTLVVLPKAGHLSNVDAPEAFNAAIVDLLRRID